MHIGLVGGIGPAATDFYYRNLIARAADTGRALDLTIVHADAPTLLANLAADDSAAQCAIYQGLADRLLAAGAQTMVVTSIAGHFCIDEFAKNSPLPIIDLPEVLAKWLRDEGLARVGIMGTDAVMRSAMYGKLAPVKVIAPEGDDLARVHEAYVTLAQSGRPTPQLRELFVSAGKDMVRRGAEAVLLGGTDLNAVFTGEDAGFPIVDCAGIHIDEIARHI